MLFARRRRRRLFPAITPQGRSEHLLAGGTLFIITYYHRRDSDRIRPLQNNAHLHYIVPKRNVRSLQTESPRTVHCIVYNIIIGVCGYTCMQPVDVAVRVESISLHYCYYIDATANGIPKTIGGVLHVWTFISIIYILAFGNTAKNRGI